MDPLTPLEPPPPAYSEEQQALDRKISDALEQSLRISQPSSTEQETWEEWDEAKFEAAARVHERVGPQVQRRSSEKDRLAREDAAHAHAAPVGASSSSRPNPPHVNTGSLGRRLPASPPANISTKERPSWFAQAQLDQDAPPPTQLHHIPPEEPSPDEQLPAFTAVGPSLEGPPFDEVVRIQHRTNVVAGDSPPQSPLDSVDGSNSPPSPPAWAPLRPTARGSYFPEHVSRVPPPPVPQTTRTSSGVASPRPPRPPPIPFDHSMAYVKPHKVVRDNVDSPTAGTVDASAFYNSAVSSLFNSPSSRPQLPKKTNALNRGPLSGSTGLNTGSYSSHTSDARASSDSHAHIPSPNSGHESSPSQGNAYGSYSPQPLTYPSQQPSYPPPQPSYPQQLASYAPHQQASYSSPSQSSYSSPSQSSYSSPSQSSYSPQHQPYPPQQPQYAPQYQPHHQQYNAPVVAPGPPAQAPWTQYRDQYGSGPDGR